MTKILKFRIYRMWWQW